MTGLWKPGVSQIAEHKRFAMTTEFLRNLKLDNGQTTSLYENSSAIPFLFPQWKPTVWSANVQRCNRSRVGKPGLYPPCCTRIHQTVCMCMYNTTVVCIDYSCRKSLMAILWALGCGGERKESTVLRYDSAVWTVYLSYICQDDQRCVFENITTDKEKKTCGMERAQNLSINQTPQWCYKCTNTLQRRL